jgi:hypothetical protein
MLATRGTTAGDRLDALVKLVENWKVHFASAISRRSNLE